MDLFLQRSTLGVYEVVTVHNDRASNGKSLAQTEGILGLASLAAATEIAKRPEFADKTILPSYF